jgi:hypothetical protein
MEKKLVPYSVHLREDIYLKLKDFAKDRKATALVRDAITMIVEGDDAFNGGYNKAVRDIMAVIEQDQWCKAIGVDQVTIAEHLNKTLEQMILPQKVNS